MKQIKQIWIIGAGKLGRNAADTLQKTVSDADILIVDHNIRACHEMEKLSFRVICKDGVAYLVENLIEGVYPDWIVPMIPVHVAYEWIRAKLIKTHQIESLSVPAQIAAMLPNAINGPEGQVYTSNADFVCPPNCSEPDEICKHTGKPRPLTLHQFLGTIRYQDYRPVVIRSHQLSAGIGGYPPAVLFKAMKIIASKQSPVLMSTACRCHAVMHAFRIRKL